MSGPPDIEPDPRLRKILALLAFAQLIVALDYNIVYVALPDIGSGLGFSDHALQWVVSAYAVLFGGFLLVGGRACDVLDRRRVFVVGLGLYATASLVGGLALQPWMLLAARGGQGLGGALLFPATLSLVSTTFPEGAARHRALSVWGAAGASGMIVGSLAGGVLTDLFGWRSVFFVNVPLAAVAIVAALRVLVPGGSPGGRGRLNLVSASTATAGSTLAVLSLVQGPATRWLSPVVLAAIVGAAAMVAAFVLAERRSTMPLLPLRLFDDRNLRVGVVVTFLFMATIGAALYFLTIYFQGVHGYSALRTGFAFLVPMGATCAGSMVAGRVADRVGLRRTLVVGLVLAGTGAFLIGVPVSATATYTSVVPGLAVFGIGQGMAYTLMFAAATSSTPGADQGAASGLASMTQQIGGAVGLAVLIAVADGMSGPGADAVGGVRWALAVIGCGTLLTAGVATRFHTPVPSEVTGDAPTPVPLLSPDPPVALTDVAP